MVIRISWSSASHSFYLTGFNGSLFWTNGHSLVQSYIISCPFLSSMACICLSRGFFVCLFVCFASSSLSTVGAVPGYHSDGQCVCGSVSILCSPPRGLQWVHSPGQHGELYLECLHGMTTSQWWWVRFSWRRNGKRRI